MEGLSQCRFLYHKSHIHQPRKKQCFRDAMPERKSLKYGQDLK